ncbi:MAG: S41 family peptidase [Clostridia bacterium]|nr:S41 family peptidase [Clostridia bacterium]
MRQWSWWRRPLVGVVAAVVVAALVTGPSRAAGGGEWEGLTPQEQSELAPLVQAYEYITADYAGGVDRQALVDAAIDAMVKSLGDPHSAYFTPEETRSFTGGLSGQYEGIGVEITADPDGARIVRVFPDSPAAKAGLQADDVITAVDGVALKGHSIDGAAVLLRGQAGTGVDVTVRRGTGEGATTFTRHLVRGRVAQPSVDARMLTNDIGYIRIDQFNENTGDQFVAAYRDLLARGLRGLVLDLRDNPGGYVSAAVQVAGALVPEGPVVRIVDVRGQETDFPADPLGPMPQTAVLVNGQSASAAEIVAGALQDNGAVLVGQRTYGKGSVQSLLDLANGATLKLTTAHYLTPKRRAIDHVGLAPDIPVDPKVTVVPGNLGDLGKGPIRYHDKGAAVSALQARLRFLGYDVTDARGDFEGGTLRALMLFEIDHRLPVTYEVTDAVRKALEQAVAEARAKAEAEAEAQRDPALEAAVDYLLSGKLPQAAGAGAEATTGR